MINGVVVPALTFFNNEYRLINELNSLLYRHIVLNGANGVFLFGTTGEGMMFTDKIEQKINYINLTIESEQKVPVLLGVWGNDEDKIIDEIKELAIQFPALNFVIIPPMNEKKSIADLKSYFETILGSLDIKNPIYLYNNPDLFAGNNINQNILRWLLTFSNLAGIIDSSRKIKTYKGCIEFLSEEFSVYCGRESNFSNFLQLIPQEKRKYAGLAPSIGNLSNISKKLYQAALEKEPLKLVQLQEELNDFRDKIYDIKVRKGKQQRGLKYAFYNLYEDIISTPEQKALTVAPRNERILEDTVKDRITATVQFLFNQSYIDRFYKIGNHLYDFTTLASKISKIDKLQELGELKKIKGPYGGRINKIYRIKLGINSYVLRARTSQAFRYEGLIKEKVLFPFLDSSLHKELPDLGNRVDKICGEKKGSYTFDEDSPSVIPVYDLIYYDETKELFPHIYSIHEYLPGKTLYSLLEDYKILKESRLFKNFLDLFENIGKILGKIHEISFNGFYYKIDEIGHQAKQLEWGELFQKQLEEELSQLNEEKLEIIPDIKQYFEEHSSLIKENEEAVLIHNDFQGQNIIVKEEESTGAFRLNGLIDFDNWRVGVRAQDFVKINFWTLNPLNDPQLKEAFYKGYQNRSGILISETFEKKIEIYSLLWFLKVYNFEMDKMQKGKQGKIIDKRFPPPEQYINEIKKILTP
ncbi:MAG: dihydrodipicolinate synthase family protein [Promethearchaeia archaeon]